MDTNMNMKKYLMVGFDYDLGLEDNGVLYVFQVIDVVQPELKIIHEQDCLTVYKGSLVIEKIDLKIFRASRPAGIAEVLCVVCRCDLNLLESVALEKISEMLGAFPESEIELLNSEPGRDARVREEGARAFLDEGLVSLPFFIANTKGFARKLKGRAFDIESEFGLAQIKVMPALMAGITI